MASTPRQGLTHKSARKLPAHPGGEADQRKHLERRPLPDGPPNCSHRVTVEESLPSDNLRLGLCGEFLLQCFAFAVIHKGWCSCCIWDKAQYTYLKVTYYLDPKTSVESFAVEFL